MPAATAVDSAADDPGDIVATVARHVRLLPHGEHQLRGVCPGCGYPALIVRPRHGTFHCFGCGAGGGPARFLADLPR